MKYKKIVKVTTTVNTTFEKNGILHTSENMETQKEFDSITSLIKNDVKELIEENFIPSREIKEITITLNKLKNGN